MTTEQQWKSSIQSCSIEAVQATMPSAIVVATGVPLSPPPPSLRTTRYFVKQVYDEQIHEWHKRPFLILSSADEGLFASRESMVREGRKKLVDNNDVEGLVLSTVDGTRLLFSAKSGNIRDGQAVFISGTFLSKVYEGQHYDNCQAFQKWIYHKVKIDLNLQEECLVMHPVKPSEDDKKYTVYFGRIRA
jgi:hypothetical protein